MFTWKESRAESCLYTLCVLLHTKYDKQLSGDWTRKTWLDYQLGKQVNVSQHGITLSCNTVLFVNIFKAFYVDWIGCGIVLKKRTTFDVELSTE